MTLVATQVKRRRGTGAENDAFTGAEGEITVDLTNKELRVHTGDNKVGGYGLARKDFENITDEAKNISNWSSNVSKCITNIPQDIKLELSNGTLTLKAGSKVYVPNGSGVFNEYIVPSDITRTSQRNESGCLFILLFNTDWSFAQIYELKSTTSICSGSTDSLVGTNPHLWYDTTNNLVKYYNTNGELTKYSSFPICVGNVSAEKIENIDRIFNGFGYIGSTKFVLPRVSGLIPDGFNSDGTLKNIPFVVENVLTTTGASTDTVIGFVGADSLANHSSATYMYDPRFNLIVRRSDGVPYSSITGVNRIPFTNPYSQISGQIQYCSFYNAFNALDYSNTEYIAHQVMPSGRADSLTVGTAGTIYTAPADGWFNFVHQGSNGQWIMLTNTKLGFEVDTTIYNQGFARVYMPCRKGDTVEINYSASGSYKRLNFYYAEGSK